MVHPGMVGITELMTDDQFAGWMDEQEDEFLAGLSTFEVYSLYCRENEIDLN